MTPCLRLLVLKTHELVGLVQFYEALGFEFAEERHGNGPIHYSTRIGESVLEIYPLPTGVSDESHVRLGFALSNPDRIVAEIESLGGTLVKSGRETPWGYMAIVADPDGRVIELYRAMDPSDAGRNE